MQGLATANRQRHGTMAEGQNPQAHLVQGKGGLSQVGACGCGSGSGCSSAGKRPWVQSPALKKGQIKEVKLKLGNSEKWNQISSHSSYKNTSQGCGRVQCLLCKHEDLSSVPSAHVWSQIRKCMPVTSALGSRDRWIPRACWPASLANGES